MPPDPQTVGLYITACASGTATGDKKPNSVSTIVRRLSSLSWNYAQRGQILDRKDRHIATVMAGIRNTHAAPPRPARRARLLGRSRRAPRAKAARPRFGRNDSPLSTPPRQVQGELDQGGGAVAAVMGWFANWQIWG